jgi:PelA/Pel-15E family pectate lyase
MNSAPRLLGAIGLCFALCFSPAAGAPAVEPFLKKPAEWFLGEESGRIAGNILSWQAAEGGWPKNTDTTKPYAGDRGKLQGTFDNSATTGELRFLARRYAATQDRDCQSAFTRGLAHILQAQYPNGGWPQYAPPPPNKYHRHITFNDHTMVRLMEFVREVATGQEYGFVEPAQRAAAQGAFDRGVECILKCQIRVNGKLTGWCAQHDEVDYRPRPARTFELASLSGSESVGITRLLMSLPHPRPEVVSAIESAVAWLESVKIRGLRVVETRTAEGGKDVVVQEDAAAPPLWARFYEMETGRPLFAGRDGVKQYALAEIEKERRTGYSWLGPYAKGLLEKEYPEWQRRNGGAKTKP